VENPNLLRGLAPSMVVKFADYWTDGTRQYPAPCYPTGATTYASLSQLAEAPGWGPGHSFHFAGRFPYLIYGIYVARKYSGFWKQPANCSAS